MGMTPLFLGKEAVTLEEYRRLVAEGKRPDTATSPPERRVSRPVPLDQADHGGFGPSPTPRGNK